MRANDVKLVSFRRGMLGEIASGGERKGPFLKKKKTRVDFYDVWVSVYISNMTQNQSRRCVTVAADVEQNSEHLI